MSVGWIFETAVDRFLEGSPSVPDWAYVESPLLQCPYCEARMSGTEALSRHIATNHPLDMPVLSHRGQAVPSEYTVRALSVPDDLEVAGTDCIEVAEDGGPSRVLTRADFMRSWCSARNSVWDVSLTKHRAADGTQASARYRVLFLIPDPTALEEIDRWFVQVLAAKSPSRPDVLRFAGPSRAGSPDGEYAGALADYALGLILKEQPESAAAPVQALLESAQKMKSALAVLGWFPRPVAVAVSSVIRFNLNWYRHVSPPAAMPALRAATELLRRVSKGDMRDLAVSGLPEDDRTPAESPICPVDRMTGDILSLCHVILTRQPISVPYIEAIEAKCSGPSVTEADLVKLRVLLALCWTRLGQADRSRLHLERLRYDALTERWANTALDDMKAAS